MAALLVGVWVDLGPSLACGVELCLPLFGAWGGAEELSKSDHVECVRSEDFWECVEGKIAPTTVLRV